MISYPFVSKITSSNPYGDRAITDEMERQFNMTCWSNGVFLISQNGNDLLVSPDNGMSIKITPGACHILGAKAVETKERIMTLSPSNSSLDRIDRVVARFDLSESIRSIELYLKEGTPSTTPVAPDLVRASNYYELALADIRVNAGANELSNADILDQRQNPEVCGFVVPAFPTDFNISDITSRYADLLSGALGGTTAGALADKIEEHSKENVFSEKGVHGIRYFEDELQIKGSNGDWGAAGSSGIAPSNVKEARVGAGNSKLTIYWSDPEDTTVEGQTIATWKGTKLVQKVGSYPENPKDGVLLLDNQERNKYKDTGFEINNLVNGRTYYFALFPYSTTNSLNLSTNNRISGTPQEAKIMTAKIDLSNSNPATCVSYADDAVDMAAGSDAWDEFFGHYPCLFKDGKEVGKLNRNDFTKFADGRAADITSGSAGDVMIAFPRRGVRISTSGDIVTVSMTEAQDDPNFKYYAHTKGADRRDIFYLGAYKGYKDRLNKLRSISGKKPQNILPLAEARTIAQANGTGYEQSAFYQLIFRQVMYILKYKNLNSQAVIGAGYTYTRHDGSTSTGGSEAYGMDSELIRKSDSSYIEDDLKHVKLFGIEDFWGNINEWIDGLTSNSKGCLTSTGPYNDNGKSYRDNGPFKSDTSSYSKMSKPAGTSELGFIAKETKGSDTTYFADRANFDSFRAPRFGGSAREGKGAGAFCLIMDCSATDKYDYSGARLMYL